MSLLPKPNLSQLQPCLHGGINYWEAREIGIPPETIVDFSVNINPFGPPPEIKQALSQITIDNYPDSEARELKQGLATKLGVALDNILVANGSIELVRLLALAYLNQEDLVIIPHPTFGEYEFACRLAGCCLLKPWAKKEEDFRIKIEDIVKLAQKCKPKAIFLCNPNNPTGQYFGREEVEQLIPIAEESLIVIDEAYINFVDDGWSSINLIKEGNFVLLRSLTKDYALAGLRLGYAIADESIISMLCRIQPPWNVNVVAQKAGLIALGADDYLRGCRANLRQNKDFLITELVALGLSPLPSRTNFFLVEVGDAKKFRQALLRKGILVRDCTSFGLPNYIRLVVRTLPECQKLIVAIKESEILQEYQALIN